VVNRNVGRVRTLWRWAEREGLVPRGSWEHLRTLEPLPLNSRKVRHTEKRKPATWDQLVKLLPHVHPTVAAMLEVQWYTGMRPNELVRLRVRDIDRAGPLNCWLYLLEQDKSSWRGQGAEPVVFGPRAQQVLLPLLERPPDAYLFPPIRKRSSPHFTVASYSQAVRRACVKYGVERFCPYALRHSARQRITRELSLDHARSVLRHKSIGTTNDYGAQVDLHLAAEAARKTG
jgi:integrase